MGGKRSNMPQTTRRKVFERDGDICSICGKPVTAGNKTVDHITPVVLGGSDQLSNLRAAHRSCNSSKSDRLPTLSDVRPRRYDKPGEPIERVIEAERGSPNNLSRKGRQQKDIGFLNLPKMPFD